MCFATKLVKGIGLGGAGGNIPLAYMKSREKKQPSTQYPTSPSSGSPLAALGGEPYQSQRSLMR